MKTADYFKLNFAVIILMAFLCFYEKQADAQGCGTATPEVKTASDDEGKCGVGELNDPSTPPKIYLKYKWNETGSGSYNENGVTPAFNIEMTGSYSTTSGETWNYLDCSTTYASPGNGKYNDIEYYSADPSSDVNDQESDSEDPVTGDWSPDFTAFGNAELFLTTTLPAECVNTSTTTPTKTSTITDHSGSIGGTLSGGGSYGGYYDVEDTTTVSDEFTDDMLIQKLKALMPSYPSEWSIVNPPATSFGSASYSINSYHTDAGGGRMQYRFHVMTCVQGVTYKVEWDEVTTYPNGSAPSINHMTENVAGNGDPVNGTYTSVHTVDVPSTPCTITVSGWSCTMQPPSPGGN